MFKKGHYYKCLKTFQFPVDTDYGMFKIYVFIKDNFYKCQNDGKLIDAYYKEVYIEDTNIYFEEIILGKPKFKIGDWIYLNSLYTNFRLLTNNLYQIEDITDTCYITNTQEEIDFILENNLYKWNIKEHAKDGDILADENNIIIYKGLETPYKDDTDILCYGGCALSKVTDGITVSSFVNKTTEDFKGFGQLNNTNYHPATEYEIQYLLDVMSNAGFIWDNVNKRIIKAEKFVIKESVPEENQINETVKKEPSCIIYQDFSNGDKNIKIQINHLKEEQLLELEELILKWSIIK